jgi:type IV secretory pathway VirB2 component (pilin)
MTMIVSTIAQTGNFAPQSDSALLNAVNWISGLLFGQLAISVAVIAIAWLGFSMLQGHINPRRALSVLVGCFLIFGARAIAQGLHFPSSDNVPLPIAVNPSPLTQSMPRPPANQTNAFDPYAGAMAVSSE